MQVGERVRVELVELFLVPDPAEAAAPARRPRPSPRRCSRRRTGAEPTTTSGSAAPRCGVAVDDASGRGSPARTGPPRGGTAADSRPSSAIRSAPASVDDRRAVGDQLGGRTELVAVVVGDALRVGDQRVGPADRERLGEPVVALADAAPTCRASTPDRRRGWRPGSRAARSIGSSGALAALNTMAASTRAQSGGTTDSAVWLRVSRDRLRNDGQVHQPHALVARRAGATVRRRRGGSRRRPRVPASTSREPTSSTQVSKPPYRAGTPRVPIRAIRMGVAFQLDVVEAPGDEMAKTATPEV